MTRWDGVLAGAAAALIVESINVLAWGRLTLVGGVAGSLLAGYVAGEELPNGAWHGLLAALAWGIVAVPASVLVALRGGGDPLFPVTLLAPLLRTPGELTTAIVLGVTLPNLLAGALGSAVRWVRRPRPDL
jgi:hypothetical protein